METKQNIKVTKEANRKVPSVTSIGGLRSKFILLLFILLFPELRYTEL